MCIYFFPKLQGKAEYMCVALHIFKKCVYLFYLEDNYFETSWWPLPDINMNQP